MSKKGRRKEEGREGDTFFDKYRSFCLILNYTRKKSALSI